MQIQLVVPIPNQSADGDATVVVPILYPARVAKATVSYTSVALEGDTAALTAILKKGLGQGAVTIVTTTVLDETGEVLQTSLTPAEQTVANVAAGDVLVLTVTADTTGEGASVATAGGLLAIGLELPQIPPAHA